MKDPLAEARKFARENPHFAAEHGIDKAITMASELAESVAEIANLWDENVKLRIKLDWVRNPMDNPSGTAKFLLARMENNEKCPACGHHITDHRTKAGCCVNGCDCLTEVQS